ncbi:MAG: hypothetical protein DRN99_09545, partial [Thermoproteota archaeon]
MPLAELTYWCLTAMLYLLALAYSIRLHLCGIYSMKASWRSSLREAEPTESPRVAAVIPAYRESPEVVERAVRSCLSLGVAEVVVVEDLDGCEPRLTSIQVLDHNDLCYPQAQAA